MVCEVYLKLGYSLPPGLRTFYIDRIVFGRYYAVAGQKYQARPCELPAILIEAETDSSAVWQNLIPHGLLIRKMPAKHMLREPHVGILAGHLGEYLERVSKPVLRPLPEGSPFPHPRRVTVLTQQGSRNRLR